VQGRPVVVADLGILDPAAVAEAADVVVVDQENAAGADIALTAALRRVGRARQDVALLGRVAGGSAAEFREWAELYRLDGFELAPPSGAEAPLLREWATQATPVPTLRAALGLSEVVSA
jgi:hypothetical protein